MMGSSIKNHDIKDGISVMLTGGRRPCHDTLQVLPFGPPTGPVPQPHLKPRETQTSVIHCELDISVWHLKLGLSQAKPVIIPIPTQKPALPLIFRPWKVAIPISQLLRPQLLKSTLNFPLRYIESVSNA